MSGVNIEYLFVFLAFSAVVVIVPVSVNNLASISQISKVSSAAVILILVLAMFFIPIFKDSITKTSQNDDP